VHVGLTLSHVGNKEEGAGAASRRGGGIPCHRHATGGQWLSGNLHESLHNQHSLCKFQCSPHKFSQDLNS